MSDKEKDNQDEAKAAEQDSTAVEVEVMDGASEASAEAEAAQPTKAPEEMTLEEFQKLQEKAAKADEYWEKLVRQAAEFENFKKRSARERQEAQSYARQSLMEELLPVIDNFEMALQAVNTADTVSIDSLKMGVEMIATQLKRVIQDNGLEEIIAEGKPFDHNLHEAVSTEVSDLPEGQVIRQLRKGYKLKDRLIRAASVVVSGKAESAPAAGETKVDSDETPTEPAGN